MHLRRFVPRPVRSRFLDRNFDTWLRLCRSGRITVGRGTYGVPIVWHFDHDAARLTVGAFTSIGPWSTVMLGGQHPTDRVTTYPLRIMLGLPGAGKDGYPKQTGDTVIGSDVWIGAEAFIGAGVTVGHGAVIAARAVVVRDVPPYAVVAGNPAVVKKYRATPDQINALLDIAWWDWPEEQIRAAADLLTSPDGPGEFISRAASIHPA